MQQNNLSNSPLGNPPELSNPYDLKIANIERCLFNETSDTTRRINQIGYDDRTNLRNPNPYESIPDDFKGLFNNVPPINPNGPLQDYELQESISRYFNWPFCGNEFSAQEDENNNNEQIVNALCHNDPSNSTAPIFINYNQEPSQVFPSYAVDKPFGSIKPLKSILRNAVCRPEPENQDYSKPRQVSFDPQWLVCPSKSVLYDGTSSCSIPGQMEWASQNYSNAINSNQNYGPANWTLNPSYSTQNIPRSTISENNPFKYQYYNNNSNVLPDEQPQKNYVNDPSQHLTPYKCYDYNERSNRNDINVPSGSSKCDPSYAPQYPPRINVLHENANIFSRSNHALASQLPPNSQLNYSTSNQPEMHNNFNQCEKYINMTQSIPKEFSYFLPRDVCQPRTQQRETIYLGGNDSESPFSQIVQSSQPCYAIPVDMAYFHSDRFELFVDAKLLIPERLRLNIMPDRVELYGCTEYHSIGSKSLLEIIRVYDLPARIIPEKTNCILDTAGILFITALWENPL